MKLLQAISLPIGKQGNMKKINKKSKNEGFSLIEVLVVLVVFSFIGIIVSQSIVTTLRGAKRSDSDSKVRANIDYAVAIMGRHLRNARTVSCPSATRVNFTDQRQQSAYFSLQTSGTDRYIASSSATQRLTNSEVEVTNLTFVCTASAGNVPPSVTITISARDRSLGGVEQSRVTTSTRIMLRTNL